MKNLVIFFVLFFTLAAQAQYNSENLSLNDESRADLFTFKNLRLYPVIANETFFKAHEDVGNYMTLQEALETEKVIITEVQTIDSNRVNIDLQNEQIQVQRQDFDGQVNTLWIENVSDDTVLIMPGEVVKGGKQDRVIAEGLIIPPKSGKIDLSVFCVEHGRWSYDDTEESFQKHSNVLSVNVRKAAILGKDQSAVWEEVSKITSQNNAQTESGTYTALDTLSALNTELKYYINHFLSLLTEDDRFIGVVVVTGDRVLGCDMFATNDLFKSRIENLLYSYSTEAISNGARVNIDQATVYNYLNNLIEDENVQEERVNERGTMLKSNKKKLQISTF